MRKARLSAACFWFMTTLVLSIGVLSHSVDAADIPFTGDAAALQLTIDGATDKATIVCDGPQVVISKTINIRKPLTLKGLKARLAEKLGRTPMIVVSAEDVELTDMELHGNYKTVDQNDRSPMIWLQRSRFSVQRCKFFDGTKDGVMVTPVNGGGEIVGGTIRDIEAFRMGRDAVSISGGNRGQKVRKVTVENVSLRRGYLRGSVEVSDGTDNITVRGVYAEDAVYAIDVQDHKGDSAANTNIVIEDVEAVNCRHIIRTANSPRGHAHLTLRKLTGKNCESPVKISHTNQVTIEHLTLECKPASKSPPINLVNCQEVRLHHVDIKGLPDSVLPVAQKNCRNVSVENLVRVASPAD